MCVFIVDDDPAARNSLGFLLESEGYQVRTFDCGAEVLSILPGSKPDCLVIDYFMPVIDGLELVQRLRDKAVLAPVILITGHPDPRIRARAADADLILIEKPQNQDILLGAIKIAIAAGRGSAACLAR